MEQIRIASEQDLAAIVAIYNQAVQAKYQTADLEEWSVEQKQTWLQDHTPESYPIFVLEKDNIIAGWASITPYRKGRQALLRTVEISYYIHQDFRRQGIATRLVSHTLQQCKAMGFKVVFAVIIDRNVASINLLKNFGFENWGYLPQVADFSGDICGHQYMGLLL